MAHPSQLEVLAAKDVPSELNLLVAFAMLHPKRRIGGPDRDGFLKSAREMLETLYRAEGKS